MLRPTDSILGYVSTMVPRIFVVPGSPTGRLISFPFPRVILLMIVCGNLTIKPPPFVVSLALLLCVVLVLNLPRRTLIGLAFLP